MKVCAVQLDVHIADRDYNTKNAAKQIELAMGSNPDVLVLPELWDLGFYPTNVVELGDDGGKKAQAFLSEQAARHNVNIVGGSIVRREGEKIWNTTYVFDRKGQQIATYDKIHLFSPSGEHVTFQAGNALNVFQLDGVPVGSVICYDMRFGELIRSLALEGIKLLIAPAAWPHPRLPHWRLLAQARAVENQFFVVAVNASGKSETLTYCGHSIMVNPWGDIIAEAGEGEQILTGECDFGVVEDIRSRINVFRDRRHSLYTINRDLQS